MKRTVVATLAGTILVASMSGAAMATDGPPPGAEGPPPGAEGGPPPGAEGSEGADFDPQFGQREAENREQIYDRQAEFERMDADADGFLAPDEYVGTSKLFEDLDANDDGLLDLDEARYMMTFAEIPAGTFSMGTDEPIQAFFAPATDSGPAHEVSLDGFQMGATEITTAQYAMYLNSALEAGEITVRLGDVADDQTRIYYPVPAWVVEGPPGSEHEGLPYIYLSPITALSHNVEEDTGLLIPMHPLNQSWISYIPELEQFQVHPGFEDWPAAFVKWWGAQAFADYYGLSLPTEAEWEYAASGGEQFRFATGDGTYGCDDANYRCDQVIPGTSFEGSETSDQYIGFRMTVGTYPPNPLGVYDLAGNVWEWTQDWYDEDYYQYLVDSGITSNPVNLVGEDPPMDGSAIGGPGQEFSHDARVTRGGSYNYGQSVTRTEYRFPVYSYIANDHFGARVVLRSGDTVFNGTD